MKLKVVCRTSTCDGCAPVWLVGDRRLTTEECGGTSPPALITNCADTQLHCAAYGRSVCLPPYTLWARKNCPLFCGFCTGNKIIPQSVLAKICFVSTKQLSVLKYANK